MEFSPTNRDLTLQTLEHAVRVNEETLDVAREAAELLGHQEQEIRQIIHQVDRIDERARTADIEIGKIKSLTGHGWLHRLKRVFCCLPTVEQAIREHRPELRKKQAIAHPIAPQSVPVVPITSKIEVDDPEDKLLDTIEKQVADLKENAIQMSRELDFQNAMLQTAKHVTTVTIGNLKHARDYTETVS